MKIRFRQRNHSRIQQNSTAPAEYRREAFAGLPPSDARRAFAASCQGIEAPFSPFTVKLYPGPYTSESATNAAIAFIPKTRIGTVQVPRHRLISNSQYRKASNTRAKPALKSTNELVQRFLLMGNHRFQVSPAIKARIPKSNMRIAFVPELVSERSQWPVTTPIKVVAMAGMVLRMPSGSWVPL